MVDYRKLKIGDELILKTDEFDGKCEINGTVTFVFEDYSIMSDDCGDHYWIDDNTAFQFFRR